MTSVSHIRNSIEFLKTNGHLSSDTDLDKLQSEIYDDMTAPPKVLPEGICRAWIWGGKNGLVPKCCSNKSIKGSDFCKKHGSKMGACKICGGEHEFHWNVLGRYDRGSWRQYDGCMELKRRAYGTTKNITIPKPKTKEAPKKSDIKKQEVLTSNLTIDIDVAENISNPIAKKPVVEDKAPVSESNSPASSTATSPPISPVEQKKSPVVEDKAPVSESNSPASTPSSPPISPVEKKKSPVVEDKASVSESNSPASTPSSPPISPVVKKPATPVVEKPATPVVEKPATPVVEKPVTKTKSKKSSDDKKPTKTDKQSKKDALKAKASTAKKSSVKYKITEDHQLMELDDGLKTHVNTEEEVEDDIYRAYKYVDDNHYGEYIGNYDSQNEKIINKQ